MSSVSRAIARALRGGIAPMRAHVVRAVGELDDDHAQVAHHREQHLAEASACASSRLLNLIWSSLVTPSTISATSAPNCAAISALAIGVSSMTSCRIAADDRVGVEAQLGEDFGDGDRVGDVGFAGAALLALVGCGAEFRGARGCARPDRGKIGSTPGAALQARRAPLTRAANPGAWTHSP
jgi:hypothetical protein